MFYLPLVVEVSVEAKRAKRARVVEKRANKVMTIRHTLSEIPNNNMEQQQKYRI